MLINFCQYRLKRILKIRKKDVFVTKVVQCERVSNKKIGFEKDLIALRRQARRSNREITVTDFGAGSKKLGSKRSIGAIYQTSVASQKFQRLLYHLIVQQKSKNILELGTSLGFSSIYLAKASTGEVSTIEACPAIYREATSLFTALGTNNVNAFNLTFADYFMQYGGKTYDFVYIDGHHDGQALVEYVGILKPQLAKHAVLVVDDIRWSRSMYKAWKALVSSPDFQSSVDLFRMGVLQYSEVSN